MSRTVTPMAQHYIYLVLFSFLLATGQICFKLAANYMNTVPDLSLIMSLLTNRWLWIAFALYGFSTILWIFILRVVPLNLAYPFVAIGFVLVPFAGWYFFSEHINGWYLLGTAMIIAGVLTITLTAKV